MKNRQEKSAALRQSFRTRAFRSGSYSFFASAVVIAIAVALLLVINTLPVKLTQFDISAQKLFDLSSETKETAAGLTQEVELYLLSTTGNEDTTITALLERYDDLSDNIHFSVVDPVENPGFAKQYTDDLQYNNSVLVVSGNRSRLIGYYDIYEYDYSYYYYTYDESDITLDFNGEGAVTSAIAYVTGTDLQKLYCLTGHGEQSLSSDFTKAVEQQNYEIEEISLLTVDAVPEDCACLLINGPTGDLADTDVEKLEAYISAGGRVLLFNGYNENGTDQPQIAELLNFFGCEMAEGLVMEENQNHYYQRGYLILPEYGSHDIVSPLSQAGYYVIIPNAATIRVSDTLPEDVSVTELLTTDANAYLATDPADLTKKDTDECGTFTLGAAITKGDGYFIWIGTGYVTDDSLNSLVSDGNLNLFLNAMNWGGEREEGISIHAKSLTEEGFTLSDGETRLYELALVIVIPLMVAAVGVVITVRRRRRQ